MKRGNKCFCNKLLCLKTYMNKWNIFRCSDFPFFIFFIISSSTFPRYTICNRLTFMRESEKKKKKLSWKCSYDARSRNLHPSACLIILWTRNLILQQQQHKLQLTRWKVMILLLIELEWRYGKEQMKLYTCYWTMLDDNDIIICIWLQLSA